jgi:demethylmenaquinone methyltransferase/2-methoxy-6-polyprenyl-1,4-benzoquinol methylase
MEEYKYTSKFYDILLYPFVHTIRNKVVDVIKRHKYNAILDVCCGTGDQIKLLKQNGIDSEGIDISNDMLNIAANGKIKAKCRLENATSTSYEDNQFELVMTSFALHEKDHTTAMQILKEMIRVSSKDLLIVDYELGEKTSFISKWLIYLIERIAGKEHYLNFKSYINLGGLGGLLNDIKFDTIEKHYFGDGGVVLVVLRKTN